MMERRFGAVRVGHETITAVDGSQPRPMAPPVPRPPPPPLRYEYEQLVREAGYSVPTMNLHGSPISPRFLIQELVPEAWMVLVGCILLNQTRRAQAHPTLWRLVGLYRTPEALSRANPATLFQIVKSCGFGQKRVAALTALGSAAIGLSEFRRDIREIPGCGEYAQASWELFVLGEAGVEPDDEELRWYRSWAVGGYHVEVQSRAQFRVPKLRMNTKAEQLAVELLLLCRSGGADGRLGFRTPETAAKLADKFAIDPIDDVDRGGGDVAYSRKGKARVMAAARLLVDRGLVRNTSHEHVIIMTEEGWLELAHWRPPGGQFLPQF